MSASVVDMSMSLDGYNAGPKFREAVPVSEVRHLAAPIEPDERCPTNVDRHRPRRCPFPDTERRRTAVLAA